MSAILLAIIGWDPKGWDQLFRTLAPQRDIRLWPETAGNPDDVHYACVWKPPHGMLAEYRNLKAIFSLGAGVDDILADIRVAERADHARRRCRPHHADDRIRRAACADLSSPAAALRHAAARAHVARPRAAAGERGRGRRHGPRRARPRVGRGVAAARLSRPRLEPHAEGAARHRDLLRRSRARAVPAPHRDPGLSAAVDAGDARHPQPRHVPAAQIQRRDARRLSDQRGARRLAGRCRHHRRARGRHARRRHARRVSDRAAADHQPAVDASEGDDHAAQRRAVLAARDRRPTSCARSTGSRSACRSSTSSTAAAAIEPVLQAAGRSRSRCRPRGCAPRLPRSVRSRPPCDGRWRGSAWRCRARSRRGRSRRSGRRAAD